MIELTQTEIIQAIANEAARRLGRSADLTVKLIVKSRGDEVTVEAEVREV